MNKYECDILKLIYIRTYENQRELSEQSGFSLGTVNKALSSLLKYGYVDDNNKITEKSEKLMSNSIPKNAVILAAGQGIRMIPINTLYTKGMLKVKGEILVERLINQLHEKNITDIYIVVGFMKEEYEYLMDKYNVKLIVNMDYNKKNNLYSLKLVSDILSNTYIIPCDIWLAENPFSNYELYSWYMINDEKDSLSYVKSNRQKKLIRVSESNSGNGMVGVSYINSNDAVILNSNIRKICESDKSENSFWEEALLINSDLDIYANIIKKGSYIEINTYEQLKDADDSSENLNSEIIKLISSSFGVKETDIADLNTLKKGMTNSSFIFRCDSERYIMRIPGEGTDKLINRVNEYNVYNVLKGKGICDKIKYLSPDNGYKISKYIENARECNPFDWNDVKKCMNKLRWFHSQKIKVNHVFNIFEQIEFYESLWEHEKSLYKDYSSTKKNVFSLKGYIESRNQEKVLSHIDSVSDNFLLFQNENGTEDIRLIDWEYAAMHDPHVDIAMFAIYALYDRAQIDKLIDIYFGCSCDEDVRIKIYCYVSACGLLWSNWCEYKYDLGVEFGEYSICQYRYAKEYYKIAEKYIQEE